MQRQFIQEHLGGSLGMAAVMAHEYAHITQFQTRTPSTSSNTEQTKLLELHADFMAGWYLANRRHSLPKLLLDVLHRMYSLGDRNGSQNFLSLDHHGTYQERLIAIAVGVSSKNLDRNQAYERGLEYVGVTYQLSGVPESTPLVWAVTNGYDETVDALLSFGSDPNETQFSIGITPLHIAALFGKVQILRTLLSAGARPDAKAVTGATALHFSLIDEESTRTGVASVLPLDFIISKSRSSTVAIVEALLEAGADPNIRLIENDGTPLHIAAFLGDVASVEVLLQAGADPLAESSDGSTACIIADEQFAEIGRSFRPEGKSDDYFRIIGMTRRGCSARR